MAQGDTLGVVMQSDIGSGASGGVAAQAQISGVFSASASYAIGTYVVNNGLLYRCTTPHSGAWNAAHFEQVTIGGELNTRTPVYGRGVNLLDNWYFVGGGSQQGGGQFPINQKGQINYSGTGFHVDRWQSTRNSTIITLDADGMVSGTSAESVGGIAQVIPNVAHLTGQTVTFSILADEQLATVTAVIPATPTTSAVIVGREAHLPSENGWCQLYLRPDGSLLFGLYSNNNRTMTVKAAKVELGDTQTLAHQDTNGNWVLNDPPPNYQQELARCQRYQAVFTTNQNVAAIIGFGFKATTENNQSVFRCLVITPVPMANLRVLPDASALQLIINGRIVDVVSISQLWGVTPVGIHINAYITDSTVPVGTLAILRVGLMKTAVFDANILI